MHSKTSYYEDSSKEKNYVKNNGNEKYLKSFQLILVFHHEENAMPHTAEADWVATGVTVEAD